ncbi:hypothetical protein K378_01656 [Streptomyces sp. Amel2xB2]|uniref:hypothetical protein n=1 Tax=Streptomyces sp. Amel2xB2 TaxID=1305829 RepID=UPI000DBA32A6|nr:hypothetical protein [Streptomyces sp. Amel2xB2]RAJ68768.1 hypothetical protein K378_01656 [Streptomyces sp. Amel2xB2]
MAQRRWRGAGGVLQTALRALLAGVVGGVVGVAAYSISKTGGQPLSIAVGCLIGVAVVLGGELYRRSAQLTDVRLVVLGNEMSFKTKTDMRQAAQRMFFQAATRIAVRPLGDGQGNLREALTSLKTLFDLYREPLESEAAPLPPANGNSVYELALDILNVELAPFLATWHPRLKEFEKAHPDRDESTWPENAAFREELRALQERLRPYVIGLGEVAGIPDPASHLRRAGEAARRTSAAAPEQEPPSSVPVQDRQ